MSAMCSFQNQRECVQQSPRMGKVEFQQIGSKSPFGLCTW
jgi:hypothetical protein